MKLCAIFPAAGKATRLGKLPCSKEILPIGTTNDGQQVQVLGGLLLEQFAAAGVEEVCIPTNPEKPDIQSYFGPSYFEIPLTYTALQSPSTLHSIDTCYEHLSGHDVALGFPDIVLPTASAFVDLRQALSTSDADIVLGLFPTHQPHAVDMVVLSKDESGNGPKSGHITDILIKPPVLPPGYTHTWSIALWRPSFTEYIHINLPQLYATAQSRQRELYVGDAILAAMADGMTCDGIVLSDKVSVDAGTPASYAQILQDP